MSLFFNQLLWKMTRSIHRAALQRWALDRLEVIVSSMGPRARNSILSKLSTLIHFHLLTRPLPVRFILMIYDCGPFKFSPATISDSSPTRIEGIPVNRLRQMELNLAAWVRIYEELWGSPGANTWSFRFPTRDGFHDIPRTPSLPPLDFLLSNPVQALISIGQQPPLRRVAGEPSLSNLDVTSSEDTPASTMKKQFGFHRWVDRTHMNAASREALPKLREQPALVLPPLTLNNLHEAATLREDATTTSHIPMPISPPAILTTDIDLRASNLTSLPSMTSNASSTVARNLGRPHRPRVSSSRNAVATQERSKEEIATPRPSHSNRLPPPASTFPAGLSWLANEMSDT